jgi:hypothetical protein
MSFENQEIIPIIKTSPYNILSKSNALKFDQIYTKNINIYKIYCMCYENIFHGLGHGEALKMKLKC